MKRLLFLSVVLALAGCSTTPKPTMVASQYESFAAAWYQTQSCGESGKIPTATAAQGHNHLRKSLEGYQYDQSFIDSLVKLERQRNPIVEQTACNNVAMKIEGAMQRQAPIHTNSAPTTPTFTTCNRTFGQTFCTTY